MWVCSCACMQGESYVNFHMKAFLSSSSARSPNAVPSLCISTPASPPLFLYPPSLSLHLKSHTITVALLCPFWFSWPEYLSAFSPLRSWTSRVFSRHVAQVRMMCMTGSVCAADRFNNECLTGEPKLMWHPDWKHPDDAGSSVFFQFIKLKHAIALTKPQWHPDWKTRHRLVSAPWLYLLMRTWQKDAASLCCHYCNSKK